jgi:hypothetical protein
MNKGEETRLQNLRAKSKVEKLNAIEIRHLKRLTAKKKNEQPARSDSQLTRA